MHRAWRWACRAAVLLALLAGVPSRPALGAIIETAPLELVLAHASHVALGSWRPQEAAPDGPRFAVERWLRGSAPAAPLEILGVPPALDAWVGAPAGGPDAGRAPAVEGLPEGDRLSRRGVVFLEQLDGRFHLTGMRRYGARFGAHASARALTERGRVVAWRQVINPGGPVPVLHDESGWEAYEPTLLRALRERPYAPTGPARPAVAPAGRAAFFDALGPALDWYQGEPPTDLPGWRSRVTDPEGLQGRIARLVGWMEGVAPSERLPGLEALLLLSRPAEVGESGRRAIFEAAASRLRDVPGEQAEAWLMRELEHGRYGVDRRTACLLARRLGPEPYARALALLESWVERTDVNEGSDCWYVLRDLGEGARAEAAAARRRERR